jgi:hypothetical protein
MTRKLVNCILIITLLGLFGCQSKKEAESDVTSKEAESDVTSQEKPEPDYVTVQHILIGFQGSVRGKAITRSKLEAQVLAEDILKRAQAGEDFDALVKEFTDDSHPGIYKMANHGIPADMANKVYSRGKMVPAFGDVGFPLEAGGIGMAAHDPQKSPYGWHVIKRVK